MHQDAHGQTYWQHCRAEDFTPLSPHAMWDNTRHALTLSPQSASLPDSVPPATTRAAAQRPPVTIDALGGWAQVVSSGSGDRVMAGGVVDPETEIFAAPAGVRITDIAATAREWLVILMDDGMITLRDLLDRFEPVTLAEPGFSPDRIVETPQGMLFVIDRAARAMRRIDGNPLPTPVANRARADYVFQPEPLNENPARLMAPVTADLTVIPDEIVDAAALPDGRVGVLCLGPRRTSLLYLVDETAVSESVPIDAVQSAFSLRSDPAAGRVALLVPGSGAAVSFSLNPDDSIQFHTPAPVLRDYVSGRICASLPGAPLAYPVPPQVPVKGGPPRPFRTLIAPSRPSYAPAARIKSSIIEGDADGTIWHRLYLEAQLPKDCAITLRIAASDDQNALAAMSGDDLSPHMFGSIPANTPGPRGVWLDQDSERAWLPSATGQDRVRNRCGLFNVLIQKTGATVKRITGRYLRVDIEMRGTTRATPRLYAMRVWGGRVAWRDRYLPDFLSVEDGPQAVGSDFLDRYLSLFESVLTPLEEEVAFASRLTQPDTTPTDALDWLAGWIGADIDQALSEAAKRRLLAQSVQLWRRRGTLGGLKRVLDIVTDGGIVRGDLVVLEHFHLRRTFATLLGVDLSDDENPLTPWAASNGNSHLGATFFLGDEDQKAFFALFRPELLDDPLTSAPERAAALDQTGDFFDDHAFRITVLVHAQMSQERRDLIANVLTREVPAHVIARMEDGPGSLVLALSSLVGVDTRLGQPPPRDPLTIGGAEIGQVFLTDLPSLDPRSEGGAS